LIQVDRGSQNGIWPYLLGDKGYPLLDRMLVPYKDDGHKRSVIKTLFNKCHRKGRSVIEIAFGLLKESWWVLLNRWNLDVKIVPDIFVCCYILHNLLLKQEEVDVKELMCQMVTEFDNDVQVRRA
jgi:hypothetical protein